MGKGLQWPTGSACLRARRTRPGCDDLRRAALFAGSPVSGECRAFGRDVYTRVPGSGVRASLRCGRLRGSLLQETWGCVRAVVRVSIRGCHERSARRGGCRRRRRGRPDAALGQSSRRQLPGSSSICGTSASPPSTPDTGRSECSPRRTSTELDSSSASLSHSRRLRRGRRRNGGHFGESAARGSRCERAPCARACSLFQPGPRLLRRSRRPRRERSFRLRAAGHWIC